MRIKDFSKHQHYKNRRPPWIKLYRDIIDDRAINMLADCSFRVLVGLWIIASEDEEHQGNLPDIDTLVFRLRIEKPKIIKALEELKPFLEIDASAMLADCKQVATPEREERERKRKEDKEVKSVFRPQDVSENVWLDFITHRKSKKASITQTVLNSFSSEARKLNWTLEQAIIESISRDWRGFKAEWVGLQNKKKEIKQNDWSNLYFTGSQ